MNKKTEKEKRDAFIARKLRRGKAAKNWAIVFCFFVALSFLLIFLVGPPALILVFLCVLEVILLRRIGKKTGKSAEQAQTYIPIILDSKVRSIDSIALTVGLPYDTAKEELRDLLSNRDYSKFLSGAYINPAERKILFVQER